MSDLGICRRETEAEIEAEVALRMEEYLTAQKSGDPYAEIRTRVPNPPMDMRSEAGRKLEDYRDRLRKKRVWLPEDSRDMERLGAAMTDDDYGLPEPPRPDWADEPVTRPKPVYRTDDEEF